MALDRISEEIAHFAGLFHLEIEAAKLRLDYQSFQIKGAGPELSPVNDDPVVVKSPLLPQASTNGTSREVLPTAADQTQAPKLAGQAAPAGEAPAQAASPVEVQMDEPAPLMMVSVAAVGPMFEILPNSVVAVISQSAFLVDDDQLIFDGSADFIAFGDAAGLTALADSLSPLEPWIWSPALGDASLSAMQLADAMTGVAASDVEGVTSVVLRDDATVGLHVNGVATDGPVELDDLLPAFLKPDDTVEEDGAEPAPSDGVTDQGDNPFAVEPGHSVVTGGNTVVNETVLKSVWVDAPVIAVAEDVVRLDIITQVNLRIEDTAGPDHMMPAISASLNIAEIEQISSLAQGADSAAMPAAAAPPAFWNVTEVEGDLLLMTWVQQHIFASDQDLVEVKFTGAATYISTGENMVFNEALSLALGFHYDLILIGGSLITINQITQVNVLVDQDRITGDIPDGAALNAGDNLQANTAAIQTTGTDTLVKKTAMFDAAFAGAAAGKDLPSGVAMDELFAGKAALNVLYISGDLVQANVIEQFNYLGDSDQIHFIEDMFSTAAGAEVTVTTGSNAQINAATVISVGLDSTVMAGGETYSDALIFQAELIDDAAPPVGVQLGGLATEAVAFLVDGMIDPAVSDDAGSGVVNADGAGAVDVMQTMLT